MRPHELLTAFRRQGVEVSLRGDKLHVDAPAGVMTRGLKSILAARKNELMAYLRGPVMVPDGWSTESWIDHLRYMARICMHQDRAAELRAWADGLEQGSGDPGCQARAPPGLKH
jgi:hypothetical protein